jgi:PAS domain S-box-containing protein
VTSRSEAEKSLRGLARAILKAADRAGIGVVVSSGDGDPPRCHYVSAAAANMLGYTPEQMLELPVGSQLSADSQARIQEWQAEATEGDPNPRLLDVKLVRKDRSLLPASVAISHAVIDDHPARVSFFFDTADRHRAEQALAVSEVRFRQLIEAAPDAVLIVTRNQAVYVNPSLLRLLGYDSFADFAKVRSHLHPDERERVLKRIERMMESGESTDPVAVRWRHRDGHYINVEVVDMVMQWDGHPAVLAVGRDLSGRKHMQTQLVQADRLAAVGTLAAGVAHEINNPLAYVLLNLQYLLRELPQIGGNAARLSQLSERLAEAQHGTERVSTIVRDLRTFSEGDEEARGPVDLKRVATSAIKVASAQLRARATLVEEYAEDLPFVYGNAARLEQVFLNLLINAVQALPDGQNQRYEIRVTLRRDGTERVVAEVADTGSGIPSDVLDRVFDPFFTTKPAGTGTGLGLPICHRIVTSLGGEIGVKSRLGQGTVFRVSFPVSKEYAPAPKRSTTPPPGTVHAPRGRVLVVDDELPVASMLGRVLGDEHDVRIATTAREALSLLLEEEFDVILCDLLMPGMSGMDLHAELSTARPGLEKRLIFMTGGAFTPRASEFLAAVPNHRIEKPFDLREMRRLVRETARHAREA